MIFPGGKVNLPQSVRPSYFTRRGEPRPSKRKDDSNILLPPTPAQSVVELRLFVQVLVEFGFSKPVKADSLMTKSLSFGYRCPIESCRSDTWSPVVCRAGTFCASDWRRCGARTEYSGRLGGELWCQLVAWG
jgi:hypothetical protein